MQAAGYKPVACFFIICKHVENLGIGTQLGCFIELIQNVLIVIRTDN